MLSRFLPTSFLAFSSLFLTGGCQRASENREPPAEVSVPSVSSANLRTQWEGLISGHRGLSSTIAGALRRGADEEALAMNPRTTLQEGVPSTVSMERHYRCALVHYGEALTHLGEDRPDGHNDLRRRVRDKVTVLDISWESVADLNRRYLPPRPEANCR